MHCARPLKSFGMARSTPRNGRSAFFLQAESHDNKVLGEPCSRASHLQAPIGSVASAELASAVSNAGGLGHLAVRLAQP